MKIIKIIVTLWVVLALGVHNWLNRKKDTKASRNDANDQVYQKMLDQNINWVRMENGMAIPVSNCSGMDC